MTVTILIPHFRTLKMTAYSVAQYIKCRGNHDVEIVVIDNSYPDDSIKGLEPFKDQITILQNTSEKTRSHGTSYDMAIKNHVKTEWIITVESDSYPCKPNWLDYYENLINKGFDGAGSLLSLSGGNYVHPAGMLIRKSTWNEAEQYCRSVPYVYFPNMLSTKDFDYHLMVHKSILDNFLINPEDYIEMATSYKPYSIDKAKQLMHDYTDIVNPFHNGMGTVDESLKTFGQRNTISEVPNIILGDKPKLIRRVGYEPGQWLCYFSLSMGKNIALIPTEIKWMKNRGGQQQEYTLNEAGFKHIWGVSAYHKSKAEGFEDIITFKENEVERLYNSLPENQKIKI